MVSKLKHPMYHIMDAHEYHIGMPQTPSVLRLMMFDDKLVVKNKIRTYINNIIIKKKSKTQAVQ